MHPDKDGPDKASVCFGGPTAALSEGRRCNAGSESDVTDSWGCPSHLTGERARGVNVSPGRKIRTAAWAEARQVPACRRGRSRT